MSVLYAVVSVCVIVAAMVIRDKRQQIIYLVYFASFANYARNSFT